MKIGVLAMQGAFIEHQRMLEKLGVEAVQVRTAQQLKEIDGLIIPGGESTTIGKLIVEFGLDSIILERAKEGMPIFGTCAGMIILAKDIQDSTQFRLGLMDIVVSRNAFGRQVDSFETDIACDIIGEKPYPAVFIRAPYVIKVQPEVDILATFDDKIIFVRHGNFLASAFHPELTEDTRVHEYFVGMVEEGLKILALS